MESMWALIRRLSNVVYNRMLADQRRRDAASPGGHSGTTTDSSVTGPTPHTDPSNKPQPGPTDDQPNAQTPPPFDLKGSHYGAFVDHQTGATSRPDHATGDLSRLPGLRLTHRGPDHDLCKQLRQCDTALAPAGVVTALPDSHRSRSAILPST